MKDFVEATSVGGGRIEYLDALKCLCILLVIEGHVRLFGMGVKTYDTLSGLMLYSFNMPIFFFISGFLAYRPVVNNKDIIKKFVRKFKHLVIPTIIIKLFYGLLHRQNPANILFDGFEGYWFTITLFECFCVMYLFSFLIKNEKALVSALIIFAIYCLISLSVYGEFGPKILEMNRFTKYFHFFVIGYLSKRYDPIFEKIIKNEWLKAISILFFFAILFTIDYSFWPMPAFHLLRDLVLRYLGTFVVLSFFICNAKIFIDDCKINRVLIWIGQNSLAIYLLQYFFIPSSSFSYIITSTNDIFTMHIISISATIIITGMCFVTIKLLENSTFCTRFILGRR